MNLQRVRAASLLTAATAMLFGAPAMAMPQAALLSPVALGAGTSSLEQKQGATLF